jgi:hypothetical protein
VIQNYHSATMGNTQSSQTQNDVDKGLLELANLVNNLPEAPIGKTRHPIVLGKQPSAVQHLNMVIEK